MNPKEPVWHFLKQVAAKLGFTRTMTAPGSDVVDAVNRQSDQIVELDGYLQTKSLGCSSLDNLKSNLLSVANSLPYNRAKFITFWNSGVTDVLTYSQNYAGTLYINYKADNKLIFTAIVSGKDGNVVSIGYNNGTWAFNNIGKKLDKLGVTGTVTGQWVVGYMIHGHGLVIPIVTTRHVVVLTVEVYTNDGWQNVPITFQPPDNYYLQREIVCNPSGIQLVDGDVYLCRVNCTASDE
jgi:hypothetical protein